MKGEGGDPGDDRSLRIAYTVGVIAAIFGGAVASYFLERDLRASAVEKTTKKRRW